MLNLVYRHIQHFPKLSRGFNERLASGHHDGEGRMCCWKVGTAPGRAGAWLSLVGRVGPTLCPAASLSLACCAPLRRIAPPWASVSPLCLRGLVRWSPGSLAAVARRTLEWPRQCLHGAGGQGSRGVGPGPVAKQVLPVWGRLRALVFSPPGPGCRDAPAGRGQ